MGDFMKIKIMRRTALQDLSLKPFEERVAIISITSVHNPIVELIERRKTYCLLVTAYYLYYDHSLRKLLAKYDAYIKQNAP